MPSKRGELLDLLVQRLLAKHPELHSERVKKIVLSELSTGKVSVEVGVLLPSIYLLVRTCVGLRLSSSLLPSPPRSRSLTAPPWLHCPQSLLRR
jgi:hypothetical protein